MRRRLFTYLIIFITVLYMLDGLGMPLMPGTDRLSSYVDENHLYTALIKEIQLKDDRVYLTAELTSVDGKKLKTALSHNTKVLLKYYSRIEDPAEILNAELSFRGTITYPQTNRNPHCFNYRKYLLSRGITYTATLETFNESRRKLNIKDKYERFLFRERLKFLDSFDDETRGLINGILFGDTSDLDEDVYDTFRKNGSAHVLAVSGLHIGLIYSIYESLAGKKKSVPGLVILSLVLYTYGILAMWSPSVVRAEFMIAMKLIAVYKDLRYDLLTAMSAVGIVLIINNPYVIFGASFQMSFLAIMSIAFFSKVLPYKMPEKIRMSLAAYIGLLPYQMYCFNYVPLFAVFVNLPILYLTGIFVPLNMAMFALFILSGIWERAPIPVNMILELGTHCTEALERMIIITNDLTSLGGLGSVEVTSPPAFFAAGLTLLLFFLSSEQFVIFRIRKNRKGIKHSLLVILTLSMIVEVMTFSTVTHDDLVFVDVGQGDCMHLNCGKADILIDGGGNANYNIGKNTLKSYLLKNGARDVDLAIVTHEHTDHYKGIEELSQVYQVKQLMKGCIAGQNVTAGNIKIETLWPISIDDKTGQDENRSCSVFRITFVTHENVYKVLVTGDLDSEGEREMLEYYAGSPGMLEADILKIGHHGSKTATSEEFLDAVDPDMAVIQVGKNNYGHPSEEVLKRLEKRGIAVYRNDRDGAVGIRFGKRIEVHRVIL